MEPKFVFKDFTKAAAEAYHQNKLGMVAKVRKNEITEEWGVYILGERRQGA